MVFIPIIGVSVDPGNMTKSSLNFSSLLIFSPMLPRQIWHDPIVQFWHRPSGLHTCMILFLFMLSMCFSTVCSPTVFTCEPVSRRAAVLCFTCGSVFIFTSSKTFSKNSTCTIGSSSQLELSFLTFFDALVVSARMAAFSSSDTSVEFITVAIMLRTCLFWNTLFTFDNLSFCFVITLFCT